MTYRNDRFDQSPQHACDRLRQFGPIVPMDAPNPATRALAWRIAFPGLTLFWAGVIWSLLA